MKIHHIRNATALLSIGPHRLVLDPMLSPAGAMPGFKMFGGGRQPNPLVELPKGTEQILEAATGVLITHEHPDHFDPAGLKWARARGLPVWASAMDAPNLRKKGLDVQLLEDGALGMRVEAVPTRHGRGWLGWVMGPVNGFFLAHPDEPSLYITSDAVLTDAMLATVRRLQPDVVLAPAGAANMGLGGNILFSVDELVQLAQAAPGQVVFNHLEALDHCPTTRADLAARMRQHDLHNRVHIPQDGEELTLIARSNNAGEIAIQAPGLAPGLQKWVTQQIAGT